LDDFDKDANKILEQLSHFFENFWADTDVDLFEDCLIVILPDGLQYLINKHGPTHQIWISSPFTGGHHFKQKQDTWIHTRTNEQLEHFLQHEKNNHAS